MSPTFSCPNCGGTLEYTGPVAQSGAQTISCSYCGNLVAVPTELWQPVEAAKTAQTVNQLLRFWSDDLDDLNKRAYTRPQCQP